MADEPGNRGRLPFSVLCSYLLACLFQYLTVNISNMAGSLIPLQLVNFLLAIHNKHTGESRIGKDTVNGINHGFYIPEIDFYGMGKNLCHAALLADDHRDVWLHRLERGDAKRL